MVDVQVGPPPVRVEPGRRPGVVIEEERRGPGVVIEGEGRPRDCTTRSQTETRNGVTVTERERECELIYRLSVRELQAVIDQV